VFSAAVRMDVGSAFKMKAVLEIIFCLEEETETMGITILKLLPRVIEGAM